MTQAIIDEQDKDKEQHAVLLEDDDEFEEFEIDNGDEMGYDVDMDDSKQVWQQDWDDESHQEDF